MCIRAAEVDQAHHMNFIVPEDVRYSIVSWSGVRVHYMLSSVFFSEHRLFRVLLEKLAPLRTPCLINCTDVTRKKPSVAPSSSRFSKR